MGKISPFLGQTDLVSNFQASAKGAESAVSLQILGIGRATYGEGPGASPVEPSVVTREQVVG